MAAASGLGVFLTASYVLLYFLRGFLGQPANAQVRRTLESMPDLGRRELVIAITLGALVFWIGLDTGPILNTMNGSLRALENRIEQGSAVSLPQVVDAVRMFGEAHR